MGHLGLLEQKETRGFQGTKVFQGNLGLQDHKGHLDQLEWENLGWMVYLVDQVRLDQKVNPVKGVLMDFLGLLVMVNLVLQDRKEIEALLDYQELKVIKGNLEQEVYQGKQAQLGSQDLQVYQVQWVFQENMACLA